MKTCNVCKIEKTQDAYSRRTASKDGLSYTCKACVSERDHKLYAANPSRAKKRAAEWTAANPRRRAEIRRAYDARHKDKRAEYMRRWRRNNIERARSEQRLRSQLRRSAGTISQLWWDAIFSLIETGACLYCGAEDAPLTMDHFIPVTAGGRTEVGNLVPCCKSCNSRKCNKMPEQFFAPDAFSQIQIFLKATRAAYEEAVA